MISVELRGRLGNQLFQYVACRVVAERLGIKHSIPNDWLGHELFNIPKNNFIKQPNVFNEGDNAYNKGILKVTSNTHLFGYWQSEKYFIDYEDEVREWYSISDTDIDRDECVIHLRAQDAYLSSSYVLPVSYFLKAKQLIKDFNPGISFTIVTDNIPIARKYFNGDRIQSSDIINDFSIIKSAKYKILSNSTFSWWAAWLSLPSSKMIIAPRRWMNYNYNKFKEDMFYPYDIKTKGFIYI